MSCQQKFGTIDEALLEIERLGKGLEIARKESSALMDACALLNTTLDLNKLLEIILQQSAILTSAEGSSLALIDQKTGELCFEVVVGDKKDILKEVRLPKGAGIIGWVAENGEPLLIEDVNKDSRFYQKVDEKSQFKTSSILCVPLKTKDGTIGALEVVNKLNNGKFDLNDQRLLAALSNQAAMAIENARLYRNVLEEKNKIISIVNSMGDGIIVTNDKFEVTLTNPASENIFGGPSFSTENISKLGVIISELSQVNSDATFDLVLMKPENIILSNKLTVLRNQANEITGSIIALRNITDMKNRENIRAQFTSTMIYFMYEQVQNIREQIRSGGEANGKLQYIAEILEEKISKLIQFSEIESGPLRLGRGLEKIGAVVTSACAELADKTSAKKITLEVECESQLSETEVEIDADRIKSALVLVLRNSLKFVTMEGKIRIKVTNLTDFIEIIVADNGIGIDPTLLPKILDKQYQISNLLNNTMEASFSLAYVQHVMEAHGGSMRIESTVGEGTSVFLRLPKFIH